MLDGVKLRARRLLREQTHFISPPHPRCDPARIRRIGDRAGDAMGP